ncbi:uncharacterized protein LOC105209952 [Zeugodacus cucurbitae]|uniref:uncharacterized protein LOC105209952 n=1 Tax=Zeugodacus cucurbitae TaxID=28588 RepID=UPI000596A6B1|nr:uncharacterized protein LOC105209952 [Zeugodacus cucurbitae]
MKFLVIFVVIIACANAYLVRVPVDSISSASSEELLITPPGGQPQPVSISDSISSASSEELLLLPTGAAPQRTHLSGVGVVSQPILQAVKVKVPQYGNALNTNRILTQIFGPQEANVQGARVYG